MIFACPASSVNDFVLYAVLWGPACVIGFLVLTCEHTLERWGIWLLLGGVLVEGSGTFLVFSSRFSPGLKLGCGCPRYHNVVVSIAKG